MRLTDYLDAHSITDAEFGSRIGLSQPQVSKLRRGKHWPQRETMERIREATGGAVTADDFLPPLPTPANSDAPAPEPAA